MAGGGTVVTLLLGLVMQDPGATRAESLLAAHDLPAARRAAEQLVRERPRDAGAHLLLDRKSTRLNSSHGYISYAVFCLKKKKNVTHCLHARQRIVGTRLSSPPRTVPSQSLDSPVRAVFRCTYSSIESVTPMHWSQAYAY